MTEDQLPGEAGPLPMRFLGAPVTDEETLGVARRLARLRDRPAPVALPGYDVRAMTALRVPARTLDRARARAEMEGTTLTTVVEAALEAYGAAAPGTVVRYEPPTR